MTDQNSPEERLDELREHGRQVLARVRRAQQRNLAMPVADTRTDAQIEAAYAAAMAEKPKRKPVERDGHGDSERDRGLREKRYQAERWRE